MMSDLGAISILFSISCFISTLPVNAVAIHTATAF